VVGTLSFSLPNFLNQGMQDLCGGLFVCINPSGAIRLGNSDVIDLAHNRVDGISE
jgi:hypothetical protein